MKTSILVAVAVLSFGAVSPVLAQTSRVDRDAAAYSTRANDVVVTGRSAYVDNADAADRQTFSGYRNTIGQKGFYGQ